MRLGRIIFLVILILVICPASEAKIIFEGVLGASVGAGSMGNTSIVAPSRSIFTFSPDLFLGVGFKPSFYLGADIAYELRNQQVDPTTVGNTNMSGKGLVISPALQVNLGQRLKIFTGYRLSVAHTLSTADVKGVISNYSGSGFFAKIGMNTPKDGKTTLYFGYSQDSYSESLTPPVKASNISLSIAYALFGKNKQ